MKKEELERLFCWKINSELKLFKYRIMQKEKEEIYSLAYQIDCIISIFEMLLELCKKMSPQELERCMQIPEVLVYFYWRWMKEPDSKNEEMEQSLWETIKEIEKEAA